MNTNSRFNAWAGVIFIKKFLSVDLRTNLNPIISLDLTNIIDFFFPCTLLLLYRPVNCVWFDEFRNFVILAACTHPCIRNYCRPNLLIRYMDLTKFSPFIRYIFKSAFGLSNFFLILPLEVFLCWTLFWFCPLQPRSSQGVFGWCRIVREHKWHPRPPKAELK